MARAKSGMRVGLYARVSTHDQQTLPLQREAMQEYADRRGWSVVLQIEDIGSGARERPERNVLLKAARRQELDAILVWRLDRWGRSVADLVGTLTELNELGVGFVSLTEALDLTTSAGRAMAGLLAVFAQLGISAQRYVNRRENRRKRPATETLMRISGPCFQTRLGSRFLGGISRPMESIIFSSEKSYSPWRFRCLQVAIEVRLSGSISSFRRSAEGSRAIRWVTYR